MSASDKAKAFWDTCKRRRSLPYNCSRCGRALDTNKHQKGHKGICSRCRKYLYGYRLRRRAERAKLQPGTEFALELERRVSVLEARCQRFVKYAQNAYKSGYHQGERNERLKWRNMPREFDAWNQPLDIDDKKQHFHRVARA